MIVWIDAVAAAGTPAVFGLGLVERHLHALRAIKPARIATRMGDGTSASGCGPRAMSRA